MLESWPGLPNGCLHEVAAAHVPESGWNFQHGQAQIRAFAECLPFDLSPQYSLLGPFSDSEGDEVARVLWRDREESCGGCLEICCWG